MAEVVTGTVGCPENGTPEESTIIVTVVAVEWIVSVEVGSSLAVMDVDCDCWVGDETDVGGGVTIETEDFGAEDAAGDTGETVRPAEDEGRV